ncbi:extracellular matrix protein 1-like [Conger conger]|uniref:extracellular matrix protein 1-like n=1 Tax=Conger conger TaxID=82655 RepID=UPI002A59F678|nr:extracellular matrix protein 1-like [Conger conger]
MDFLGNLRGLWMLVLLLFCMPSDGFQFPPVKPSEDNLKGICDSKTIPQSDQGSKLFNQEITLIFLESQYRRCCMKYEDQEDTLECLLEKWDTAFIMYCDRLEAAEPVQRDSCCEARDPLGCFQTPRPQPEE